MIQLNREGACPRVSALLVAGMIALCFAINQSSANSEMDNLAMMFQNGIMSVSDKVGAPISMQPDGVTISAADEKMRELYNAIEKGLLQARQEAANDRSSITTYVLEGLKLI